MPPCGNFGLLILSNNESIGSGGKQVASTGIPARKVNSLNSIPDLDESLHESLHVVEKLGGIRLLGSVHEKSIHGFASTHGHSLHGNLSSHGGKSGSMHGSTHGLGLRSMVSSHGSSHGRPTYDTGFTPIQLDPDQKFLILPPLKILEAQTASTEVRGGQAGGISIFEYPSSGGEPNVNRVRLVARKRWPLAKNLAEEYNRKTMGVQPAIGNTITSIGHTRFATSSVNIVSELHPHEWIPCRKEKVWLFNRETGLMEFHDMKVTMTISHNGDFDALQAFSQEIVVNDVGLFLERVLHVKNDCRGDSPKIAGMMELLRVQGRWAAAARLAWVRVALKSPLDVAGCKGGEGLTKSSPNTFPPPAFWNRWEMFLDSIWREHIGNIIRVSIDSLIEHFKHFQIDTRAERAMVDAMFAALYEPSGRADMFNDESWMSISSHNGKRSSVPGQITSMLGISSWPKEQVKTFLMTCVYSFLRSDLYTALTEFLSRAKGSFGLQAHSTLEPGCVVIASRGQPMSIAYDHNSPLVLFGSEAEALAVPVDAGGQWLSNRIDLDSHGGEVVRIGIRRPLLQIVSNSKNASDKNNNKMGSSSRMGRALDMSQSNYRRAGQRDDPLSSKGDKNALLLQSGIEIRFYSLKLAHEQSVHVIRERSIVVASAPLPYDPTVDLVKSDLAVAPEVLQAIDSAYNNPKSVEWRTAQSLCEELVRCMRRRIRLNLDTIDLLISGVEASLWMAEQWASDLRSVFPQLNVSTVSANKLLGLGSPSPSQVFFPGSESILERRIDVHTCCLMISQSGQTFATLHATEKVCKIMSTRVWIITGTFNSKMETAVVENYKASGKKYLRDRVFCNYSGSRPAEPSSVAVAATWHSLSRLLLHLIKLTRSLHPGGRIIKPWDREAAAITVQRFMLRYTELRRRRDQVSGDGNVGNGVRRGSSTQIPSPLALKSVDSMVTDWGSGVSSTSSPSSRLSKSISSSSLPTQSLIGSRRLKKGHGAHDGSAEVIMNLSDGCIEDIDSLFTTLVVSNLHSIVNPDSPTHQQLTKQGQAWARHISEPWTMLCVAGAYIILSVGLGLPIFGLIGDLVVKIIQSAGVELEPGILAFTPRVPSIIYKQNLGWTLAGLCLQLIDALFFVFLIKVFTWVYRLMTGRPLWARMGKRTIVIVDNPAVHQLLENFVSKLFSQSYSFCSVDVHGASGLDHFVHRFTHRVVRGLLLAIGRPDGRLCCLSKSEAAVLLSAKQAAFICNPDYTSPFTGNGPEIVTISHNPFKPNVGLGHHIVISGGEAVGGGYNMLRKMFVDEFLFNHLAGAGGKPSTAPLLALLARVYQSHTTKKKAETDGQVSQVREGEKVNGETSNSDATQQAPLYGMHNIKPQNVILGGELQAAQDMEQLKALLNDEKCSRGSCDPMDRQAFFSRLDSASQKIQNSQVVVQHLYESRVASLERYLSFCVMFHAMAVSCRNPWFHVPWDVARSQSNLRIATTASPVSECESAEGELVVAAFKNKFVKRFVAKLRKRVEYYF